MPVTVLPKDLVAPSARRVGAEAQARARGRTLVVGRDIVLSGEIESCEKLIIEGRVEGDITDTKRLEIAETGRFKGKAVVEECLVAGVCEGELSVNGLLTLRAKGRVEGTVRYVEIEVERGGRLSGDVGVQAVREVASQAEAEARAPEGSQGSG
ncbi:MAG: polymer-forming cytoskeletal protein [Gemmatimonadetes bacterium]|nr:polymer-forming cytoskeletal protein [Gemmatimonadota bacterium]